MDSVSTSQRFLADWGNSETLRPRLARLQVRRPTAAAVVYLVRRARVRPDAGAVGRVPLSQHVGPVPQAEDVDELRLHADGLGVEPAVLDPHLPHPPPGQLLAVDLH